MTKQERKNRLLPDGKPRWVRCYDNGGRTLDRYTAVFTGNYYGRRIGHTDIIGMSEYPFEPQGVGISDTVDFPVDRPTYSHLGKRITFDDLPKDCQRAVMQDYKLIWRI